MLKDFNDVFYLLIDERTNEVRNIVEMEPKYISYEERYAALAKEIIDLLPEQHKYLVYELDELIKIQQMSLETAMFTQGLKDGAKLRSIVGL